MEINEFLSIGIVGVFLSLGYEAVKQKLGITSGWSKFIVLVSAILLAWGYVWVRTTPYFATLITILGTASIIYAFILNRPKSVDQI